MELKWTDGSYYEKTPRNTIKHINKNEKKNDLHTDSNTDSIRENTAYKHCVETDNNPWVSSVPWENNHLFSETPFRISNKREENSQKLTEREMVSQIGKNPFFGNQDYIGDITNCDKFLKPECTSLNP